MEYTNLLAAASTAANQQSMLPSIILTVAFVALMYFMLIRPQRKKDKETNEMRSSLKPGDRIVTIGGIVGTIVKIKEDSVIIAVGADRTKFEIQKWGISSIVKGRKPAAATKEEKTTDESKKRKPKRLNKKEDEQKEEAKPAAKKEEAPAKEAEAKEEPAAEAKSEDAE